MDPHTVQTFITWATNLAFLTLLSLVGFFAARWIGAERRAAAAKDGALQASVTELSLTIKGLSDALVHMSGIQILHGERIEKVQTDIADIYRGGACMNENCPLRPQRRAADRRLEDGGS